METKELILGSIVACKNYEGPCKITHIGAVSGFLVQYGKNYEKPYHQLDLSPIPLTEEMIGKNFEKHCIPSDGVNPRLEYYEYKDEELRVVVTVCDTIRVQAKGADLIIDKKIRYINELQNIFFVLGIRKEFVL